jgi:signal transduction histidine kinase
MQRVLGLPDGDGFVGTYNLLGDEQARATGLAAAFERCRRGESTSILRVEVDFERDDYRRWGDRTGTTWFDNVLFPVFAPSGAIEAVVVFTWDVAERVAAERTRRRLEDQLRQSQKLEAVGMLAGGVAHDFNNILTAVLGFAEAIDAELPPEHPGRELGAQIQKAALRGARLTEQLLAFGKKQVVRAETFDPAVLVEDTTPMLRQLVGAEVRLDVATQRGCHVNTDKVQFQQVLLNLVVNARDAMPQGGTLHIAVRAQDESHVLLRVRDTGVGMDERVQARLFEPFFTTKEPGKGSGLGLATVYGIVTRAGGNIVVQSAPGAGACFDVLLPRVAAIAELPAPPPPPASQVRRARILLVEDDDANRELAARILRVHGHELLVAESGERALELAAAGGDFEMLVTDVMMPGLSGRAVAERLCAQRPQLKVLFVSGYLADDELRSDVGLARAELLQKPFTANELLATVQQVLAR